MARRRDKKILLRVSADERERWQSVAERDGVTVADLIRRRLDGDSASAVGRAPASQRRRDRPTAPPELVSGIARLGNNLNQVGRWVNTHKSAAEAVEVLAALSAIDQQLSDLVDAWTPGGDDSGDSADSGGGDRDAH